VIHPTPPVVRALLIATAVVWFVLEVHQAATTRSEGVQHDRGSRMVIRVAVIAGVVGSTEAAHAVPSAAISTSGALAWIGLALLVGGVGLRFWSFHTLGRYFTFTVQTSGDQPVITSGPYRVIRHPGYAAVLIAVIGIGLLIGNWLSLVCLTVAVLFGLVYRIEVEERALLADLGDRYRTYAATHKRLIPFIW
jgi:protein-S-isoprenylcysteine O-methyltransferase Ste14